MKFPVLCSGLVSRVGASHRVNLMHLSVLCFTVSRIYITLYSHARHTSSRFVKSRLPPVTQYAYFTGHTVMCHSALQTCVSDVTFTVLTFVTVTSHAPPLLLKLTSLISCFVLASPEPSKSLMVSL